VIIIIFFYTHKLSFSLTLSACCNPGKGAPSAPIFCYAEPPRCSKSGLTRNRHNHLKFLFTPSLTLSALPCPPPPPPPKLYATAFAVYADLKLTQATNYSRAPWPALFRPRISSGSSHINITYSSRAASSSFTLHHAE
jgi:hypothetical protein